MRVGLTFQPLQKFEDGVNRISAGRLHGLSQSLACSVEYFFVNREADLQDETRGFNDVLIFTHKGSNLQSILPNQVR